MLTKVAFGLVRSVFAGAAVVPMLAALWTLGDSAYRVSRDDAWELRMTFRHDGADHVHRRAYRGYADILDAAELIAADGGTVTEIHIVKPAADIDSPVDLAILKTVRDERDQNASTSVTDAGR